MRERPDGTLTVILHGGKLEGEWALVPAKLDGEERNWLIVRASKDGAAGPQRGYEPMIPRAAKRVPTGAGWAFEIAWDGVVRSLPWRGRGRTSSTTPATSSTSARKQLLARMPRAVRTSDCVLDGVICSFLGGRRVRRHRPARPGGRVADRLPWCDRRTRLTGLLDDHVGDVRLSRDYDDGRALRTAARAQGLGIVAKRRKSPYRPGAVSDDWRLLQP